MHGMSGERTTQRNGDVSAITTEGGTRRSAPRIIASALTGALLGGMLVAGGTAVPGRLAATPAQAAPGDWCVAHSESFYALSVQTDEGDYRAQIYEFGEQGGALDPLPRPVGNIDIPERDDGEGPSGYFAPDALGVSPDGEFYFTVSDTVPSAAGGAQTVDVYRYVEDGATGAGSAELVKADMSMISPVAELASAGAVDPVSGEYYFAYFTRVEPGQGDAASHAVRTHLYRVSLPADAGDSAQAERAERRTGEVAHVDSPVEEDEFLPVSPGYPVGAGDLVFDAQGNLTVLFSKYDRDEQGREYSSMQLQSTLHVDRFVDLDGVADPAASVGAPLTPGAVTVERSEGPLLMGAGVSADGRIFGASVRTDLAGGPASRLQMLSPTDFSGLGAPVAPQLLIAGDGGAQEVLFDAASCATPPTLAVSASAPGGLADPADGFEVSASRGAAGSSVELGSAATAAGETATGFGPIPVHAVAGYTITQTVPAGREGAYDTSWSCTITGDTDPWIEGDGVTIEFDFPSGTGVSGGQLSCAFVNVPTGSGGGNPGQSCDPGAVFGLSTVLPGSGSVPGNTWPALYCLNPDDLDEAPDLLRDFQAEMAPYLPGGGERVYYDALGVSPQGDFYFTWGDLFPADAAKTADVFRYRSEIGAFERLIEGMSLISPRAEQPSAGAVDPSTGDYYFAYFTRVDGGGGSGATGEAVRMHLYRVAMQADGLSVDPGRTGEATHVDLPVGADDFRPVPTPGGSVDFPLGFGDLAFDAAGNLTVLFWKYDRPGLTSGNEDEYSTQQLRATVPKSLIPQGEAQSTPGGEVPVVTLDPGAVRVTHDDQSLVLVGGAFTGDGLVSGISVRSESGSTLYERLSLDVVGLSPIGDSGAFPLGSGNSEVMLDSASWMTPPTLSVSMSLLGSRFTGEDRFAVASSRVSGATPPSLPGVPEPLASAVSAADAGVTSPITAATVAAPVLASSVRGDRYRVSLSDADGGAPASGYQLSAPLCTIPLSPTAIPAVPVPGEPDAYELEVASGQTVSCEFRVVGADGSSGSASDASTDPEGSPGAGADPDGGPDGPGGSDGEPGTNADPNADPSANGDPEGNPGAGSDPEGNPDAGGDPNGGGDPGTGVDAGADPEANSGSDPDASSGAGSDSSGPNGSGTADAGAWSTLERTGSPGAEALWIAVAALLLVGGGFTAYGLRARVRG